MYSSAPHWKPSSSSVSADFAVSIITGIWHLLSLEPLYRSYAASLYQNDERQIGIFAELLESFLAINCQKHLVALHFEKIGHQYPHISFIVGEEDFQPTTSLSGMALF